MLALCWEYGGGYVVSGSIGSPGSRGWAPGSVLRNCIHAPDLDDVADEFWTFELT